MKFALDIGIASVGWAVVDDSYNIIDLGSRLFDSADASKNAERREQRSRRRISRRKHHRIERFNDLWVQTFKSFPDNNNVNVLTLRCDGLNNRLSEDELHDVLRYYLKHRGISYLEDAIEEDTKSDYTAGITFNKQLLKKYYPCQIQYERFKQYNQYRGTIIDTSDETNQHLSNIFTTSAYITEISAILEKQSEFYEEHVGCNLKYIFTCIYMKASFM